ncbi:MAG: hypothetical protein A2X56_09090 [Nitrospirae bacterium GWC2_57_13]|nr:MAG: hypothetical protein A2072_06785 [Nitrospirae bacterium GWC1_57_7]OGW26893.1 MAG: hypothetical protein A2X56_09090 [Nitrospirae bacterium GWC2_57_13]OGW41373.1 MAG: hypothetical protein A2X57_09415 [Nitrospirae bacterium GWD2_57_8]HAR46483.1 hypothetical protein [Nitrospiraceae bacterium]HAS53780.1 hypothetical protein [Nitrospiraceae bacterium]
MWNKIAIRVAVLVLGPSLVGCGATAQMIVEKSQSERTDIFQEISRDEAIPAGYAGLAIKASLKTHVAGYYVGESEKSLHGKPGYPFVINIDGQAAVWEVDGQKAVKPAYDEQGKTSRDPEARAGIMYILEKKLRLRPGEHKVFFGLPEDDYYAETEITLREGEEAALEFKPTYCYKTCPTRIPTFLRGICDYESYLHGVKLN